MSEPKWQRDLDLAQYHASDPAQRAAIWAAWAIRQLPDELRRRAATAWKRGQYPTDLPDAGVHREQLRTAFKAGVEAAAGAPDGWIANASEWIEKWFKQWAEED